MPVKKEELKSAATVEDSAIKQAIGPEGGFEIKSNADGRSYVEGYIATKDSYRIHGEQYEEEVLSEEALRSIASQINNANEEIRNADAVFPDPADAETITSNIEHQNSPAMEDMLPSLADTRTVPALEMTEAEFDGYGVKVRAPIRENALPDDSVEAIKSNIEQGILSAFSIEFKNAKDKIVEKAGKLVRKIKDVDVTGSGLTAMPKNPTAKMTAAEIRSVMTDKQHTSMEQLKQEIKAEIKEELKAEYQFSEGDWITREWQGGMVRGKVRDRTKDSFTVDGNTVSGQEDEPVYKMEEYDTESEEFTGQMIAVPQSSASTWSGAPENKSVHGDMDLTPPEGAQEAAQKALDWREEYPEEIEGMTETGWSRAEQLASGEELSPADIADGTDGMANWWSRHEQNFELDSEFEAEPWKDAGYVAGLGWGGETGKNWAERKKVDIEEAREAKSKHMENKAEVAGVKFSGTKGGDLDESEIPNDDFEQHYLFPADTKSESSYPVVDADGTLRRGNVEAAKQLGARGGVDASELERKLKALNKEFDNPPLSFKEGENKSFNDTMPEDPEDGDSGSEGQEEGEPEEKSQATEELRGTVEELKSTVEEVKSKNQELEEENEELRSELEDLEEMKSELDNLEELEEELKSLTSDDQPVSDPEEQKHKTEEDQTPRELKSASSEFVQENKSVLADKYNITEEEVLEHA